MLRFVEWLNTVVWGLPALVMIVGVGLLLSVNTGFAQFQFFPRALKAFLRPILKKGDGGNRSQYQALCTALAATVGTGNLAGVAGAIALGGPGAIFWMWISALLGMVTKFAEATLAVRFRAKGEAGEWTGGPMHMITGAMGKRWHWLAGIYCFFGIVASFGVGNATQINTMIGGISSTVNAFGGKTGILLNLVLGILLAIAVYRCFCNGAAGIGRAAEALVPFAAGLYIVVCVIALILRVRLLPGAIAAIFAGAFTPRAVTGGAIGSVMIALRVGISRGVFTNEAGMGTASIAHAAASVRYPVEQGFMGIIEVFLDTVVICTLTALVILCSGVPIPYGIDEGILLTNLAFQQIYGDWITLLITGALCLFAFATVLGWGLYGMRCAQFLFGEKSWRTFVVLQSVMVVFGSVANTGTLWMLAETVNGLMAIPNLIVLAYLAPELRSLIATYKNRCLHNRHRRFNLR